MKILGIGRALASQTVTNAQLEQILDTSDEWITTRTGIKQRRVLGQEGLTDLAVAAAREALSDSGMMAEELSLILVATTMGDYVFPSLACLLQRALGASCPAMDLHAACSGFVYALQTADAFLQSGKAGRVLVVGAEAISRLADWGDRATSVLFGDGAGAVVLGPGEDLLSIRLGAYGDDQVLVLRADPGNCPYTEKQEPQKGLTMQGQDVFRFAVGQAAQDLNQAVQEAGLSFSDISYVLLHQANLRIIDTLIRRLQLDPHKVPSNIHRTGNTSAASIPLLMWELYHSGKLKPGDLLALSSFGAGLTSGACVLRWDKQPPENLLDIPDLFGAPADKTST